MFSFVGCLHKFARVAHYTPLWHSGRRLIRRRFKLDSLCWPETEPALAPEGTFGRKVSIAMVG
ncbi:MAG: hypothetical protein CBB97_09825 [Candidatus Endolissoclinum sp. TMED37]|nr:MAG: hypothetical protein CBB97_09825 [Candidatus Endolissoclinum sp. TMED37]